MLAEHGRVEALRAVSGAHHQARVVDDAGQRTVVDLNGPWTQVPVLVDIRDESAPEQPAT